jgi:hypothetical protein
MNFSEALQHIKAGTAVARTGWRDNRCNLTLVLGNVAVDRPATEQIEGIPANLFAAGGEGTSTRLPTLQFYSAQGVSILGYHVPPADMLAEDWGIVNAG